MVYAVFNYSAQNGDELTFTDGDCLQVLRKGDEHEKDWWWTRLGDSEGYIPRNLLGVSTSLHGIFKNVHTIIITREVHLQNLLVVII